MAPFFDFLFGKKGPGKSADELVQEALELFLLNGDYQKSIPKLEEAIKAEPRHMEARKTLGEYLIREGEEERGIK